MGQNVQGDQLAGETRCQVGTRCRVSRSDMEKFEEKIYLSGLYLVQCQNGYHHSKVFFQTLHSFCLPRILSSQVCLYCCISNRPRIKDFKQRQVQT